MVFGCLVLGFRVLGSRVLGFSLVLRDLLDHQIKDCIIMASWTLSGDLGPWALPTFYM